MCCNVLQRNAVCCNVLQCVAVRCSMLQCVAACCSVLQCVAVCCSALQCVAACCSVLQCVEVRCSVLQCVAACCSKLSVCIEKWDMNNYIRVTRLFYKCAMIDSFMRLTCLIQMCGVHEFKSVRIQISYASIPAAVQTYIYTYLRQYKYVPAINIVYIFVPALNIYIR